MGSGKGRRGRGAVIRAGARGLIAAMAMTGVRTVTAAIGPREKSPPEAIMEKHVPFVRRLPPRHRDAVTGLAHWAYGIVVAGRLAPERPPRAERWPPLAKARHAGEADFI